MTNDYYDFNPSATTWALLLTGFVVFVVALCIGLIYAIYRSEAAGTGRPHLAPRGAAKPVERESTGKVAAKPVQPIQPARWSAATHRHA